MSIIQVNMHEAKTRMMKDFDQTPAEIIDAFEGK